MQTNFNLQALNTLQVACKAKFFVEIQSTYQLLQMLETPEWGNEKHRILGGGSNTLFTSDFFDGIVAKINIKGIKILNEDDENITLQVGAGEIRDDFVRHAIENKRGGIENLIAIPGNVGTSAVSNIGAYGQEASESIEEVIGINLETKTIQKIPNEDCGFGYRKSIFKTELQEKFIITHVIFKLQKVDEDYSFTTEYADIGRFFEEQQIHFLKLNAEEKLKKLTFAIESIRKQKLPDPRITGTAGSYFKNPEIPLPQREVLKERFPELKAFLQEDESMKLMAGQLIELCGYKGYQEGKVRISEQHALILINEGGTGKEVADFAKKIQDSVFEKFNIKLEPEVMYCEE